MVNRFFRVFAGALLLMAILVHAASPVQAGTASEKFIQTTIDRAFAVLNDRSRDESQRKRELRNVLQSAVDIRRVALFTIGRYRRPAPDRDVHGFVKVFEDYLLALATDALTRHRDRSIRVTGSTERTPGDVLVNAEVLPLLGTSGSINIGFRVRNGGDEKDAIVDLEVEGISLAIMGRMVFYFLLVANQEKLALLSDELIRRTARLEAGDAGGGISPP